MRAELLHLASDLARRGEAFVLWLNPLMGDERYRPLARGMEAALPFVDHLAPAHNLRSFEEFLALVPAW